MTHELSDALASRLAVDPSRSSFNRLVAAAHKASADDLAVLERELASWPLELRAGGRRWLDSLAVDQRKGRWRPGWQLIRRLELDDGLDADAPGLDALLASAFTEHIEELELDHVALPAVERLLAGSDWPSLRRIDLRVLDLSAAVASLCGAAPALLRRVGRLVLQQHGKLPARVGGLEAWPDEGLSLRILWNWHHRRGEDKVHQKALGELGEALGELDALADVWWDSRLRWVQPLFEAGALRSARCLRISLGQRLGATLRAMLEHDDGPGALEALTVELNSGARLDHLQAVADTASLASVRRLAISGRLNGATLALLLETPLGADLEVLHLWHWPHEPSHERLAAALASPALAGLWELGVECNDAVGLVGALQRAGALPTLRRLLVREPRPEVLDELAAMRPDLEVATTERLC